MVRAQGQRLDLTDVPPAHRIYVNRNLRLGSIQAVGFDMDHTLARYKPLPFERLAFGQAARKLVASGYPRAILRLTYNRDFVIRGLIVDKRRGNILKMDRHHYVVTAYHGTRKIPREMRKGLYAKRRIRISRNTFVSVDSLFSLPEISLYAQVVDLFDKLEENPDYRRLYDDVRRAMDEAHADGSIKDIIARSPMRYLLPDPLLPETLDRMRSSGIRLFLLTNSEADYTALIMDRLLSKTIKQRPHWTDFFDLIVVRAGKPGFFGRSGPLRPISPSVLGTPPGSPRSRFAFTKGSVHGLEKALRVMGDRILYFGDHTYGDILRSKRLSGWRTAMILQRLEEELEHQQASREKRESIEQCERRIDQLAAQRDLLERSALGQMPDRELRRVLRQHGFKGGPQKLQEHLKAVGDEIHEAGQSLGEIERTLETTFNPHWGPIFRAGREVSHFANQVEEFACIYTTRVSNFLNYPMDKYFVTTHVYMPHEH